MHHDLTLYAPRAALLLTAVLILVTMSADATARQQEPQPRIEAADLAKRIHTLINKQRTKHGLQSLTWNDTLSRIAAKHSHDMANRNYLDHNTPEGDSFSDRYRQGGYSCGIQIGNVIHTGAENIALSRLYHSTTTENRVTYYHWNSVQEIALKTVDGWMNSPGHRKNILTPHWRHEGIGVKIGSGNNIYITQNFC